MSDQNECNQDEKATVPRSFDQRVELADQLSWGFDDEGPKVYLSHDGTYARGHKADPAPAYAHDMEAVRREFAWLQLTAPLPQSIGVFVLTHELVGRTNAFCCNERAYQAGNGNESWPVSLIVLQGKRIPIHPAMTRYLVAHEYGHVVEEYLARLRKTDERKHRAILQDYIRDVRPDALTSYGPGKWHSNAGELFANDFRILIAKREPEFWPHPGFSRPEENLAAIGWWSKVREELWSSESQLWTAA